MEKARKWIKMQLTLFINQTKAKTKATSNPKKKKNKNPREREKEEMTTAMMIFAAAVTIMALITFPAVEAQTSCVNKLIPCASDLIKTTKPADVCCSSIKEAVEKELSCLCTIYTTPGLLSGFNVTTEQALGLSRRCNVTTDLSACSGKQIYFLRYFILSNQIFMF